MTSDVLIIGAGPTGLALAIDLARRGVDVRVVEKALDTEGSRGKGLQPRTLEIFDDLGIITPIMATGETYPQIRIYAGRVPVWRAYMHKKSEPSADRPYPMVIMQPQWRTEQIMRERLAALGGKVDTGLELVGFEQDADGVTATLRRDDGTTETAQARYMIGADGGRSTVRKQLGVGFLGETRDEERMIIGDVRIEGLPRDAWRVWLNPFKMRMRLAVCPLPNTDTFQLTAPLAPGVTPDLSLAGFQRLFSFVPGARITALTWSSIYRVNIRMVDRYRVGRVFLAGDAAHVHSPAGGQGLNTGVQDAYNLGWKLAHVLAGAPDALLDTYQEERLPVAAHVLGLSTELLDRAARGSLKRGEDTDQLGISYRGTSLAAGTRGGDRLAGALDLLRGPSFALLGSTEVELRGVRSFVVGADIRGPEAFVLVRPDGYIGIATDSLDEVRTYLQRF